MNTEKTIDGKPEYESLLALGCVIARQYMDGEERKDQPPYHLTVDDAFETLHSLITRARLITGEMPSDIAVKTTAKTCFIVQGNHPTTPGRVLKVFGTLAAAEVEAKSLVEIILEAVEEPALAEGETAEQGILRAKRRYLIDNANDANLIDTEIALGNTELEGWFGDDDFDVWIQEEVVRE